MQLPPQFADLERFLPAWDLPGTNARYAKRLASGIEEMTVFFEAMLARATEIARYLDEKDWASYDAADRCLARLMFALAVVGPAVEIFHRPRVPDTDSARFDVIQEPEI